MTETCYGYVRFDSSLFVATPSVSDHVQLHDIDWSKFPVDLLPTLVDSSIFNQPSISAPLRQLDYVEQNVLHEAHMKSVKIVGSVIRK